MSRIDYHIHTTRSDGTASVDQVLEVANKKGLSAISITDHNDIRGAIEALRKARGSRLEVIIGEEISTTEGHIIGLFLIKKIERGFTPEQTIRQIHLQGGLAVVPHPFPHYKGIGHASMQRIMKSSNPKDRPDAIEVRNGFPPQLVFADRLKKLNRNRWNLAEVGGSDSHSPGSIGCCWTEFDGATSLDFKKAIKNKKTNSFGHGWSVLETARALSVDMRKFTRKKFTRRQLLDS